jgi:2-polyprenyl-3-methyl-5-hydroxy-6-metoxy-1,4-benzoquinol methylase
MKVFIIDWIRVFLKVVKSISLKAAIREQKLFDTIGELRKIVPDISKQESRQSEFNDFLELKRRGMHAFQSGLMLKAINTINKQTIVVADIGDSAGTHMLYLKSLSTGKNIETYSVNLDPRAIEKIKDRGLKAILKRAEEIEPEDIGGREGIDLFTSFEMVEHLHNPSIFIKRIASRMSCNKMVVTVPFLKQSRVGFHHIRKRLKNVIYAEDEHVFELSPEDWTLLFFHSGWKVVYEKIYFQYPRKIPIIANMLRYVWKKTDYEGFWGVILEKDLTFADLYQDWED